MVAKSELQGILDELIGQEVSVRMREQLLSQEMFQQNMTFCHVRWKNGQMMYARKRL